MDKKLLDKAKKAKQKASTWYLVCELAPTWVGEDEGSLKRPFIILVSDLDKDLIRYISIAEKPPTADELINGVLQAIVSPGKGIGLGFGLGLGGKFRPTTIQTNDGAVLEKIRPLSELGIQSEQVVKPALIVDMLRSLEQHLSGREYRPGLMSIPKVTQPMLHELYTVAAEFFDLEPFDIISDSEPIAIQFPPGTPPKYAVVMGYGGEEYGLAIYNSADELALVYSGVGPEGVKDESIFWLAALYDYPHYLPFEDLDAIAAHEWPIVAEDAYPFFTRLRPASGDFELLTEAEIRLLAAALRTIPQFVEDNVDEEDYPIMGIEDVVYELPPMYGDQAIALNWAVIEGMENRYDPALLDLDEMDDETASEMAAMGMAAIDDFIEGWDFDEEDEEAYGEAMGLGAFLLTYLQMAEIKNQGQDEDYFEFVADICWEIGGMVLDYAERPLDIQIFTGPPLFVEEYAEEVAEDDEDVANYRHIWEQLGQMVQFINEMASDDDSD